QLVSEITEDFVVPFGVKFSRDGKILLTGWADQPVRKYNLAALPSVPLAEPIPETTPPFAVSADGDWFVTAGANRHIVRRWTWPDLEPLPELRTRGGSVDWFAISPDSTIVSAGLRGGPIN